MAKRQRRARLAGKPKARSTTTPRSTAAAPAQSSAPGHPLLDQQRMAGNNAVARLVESQTGGEETAQPTTYRKIRLGDTGDDVLLARAKLYAAIGKPTNAHLGVFDETVQDAVEQFQRQKNLLVDGIVGRQTWAALDAVAGDRAPDDEVAVAELREQKIAADKLMKSGDVTGANLAYLTLYNRRDIPPIMRFGITFNLGECAQADGRFDEAISRYGEYLDLPGLGTDERANALQRLRECRLKQPPGTTEMEQSQNAKVDPTAREEGRKTVGPGDNGDSVALVQARLYAAIGEPEPHALGFFDDATEAAVKRFQGERQLSEDGTVGPQTWAALDAVAGDRVPVDEVELEELRQKKIAADKLLADADFPGAEGAYKELYANRHVPPIMRFGITRGLGTCAQGQQRFDEAIVLYQEYLDLPGLAADERADGLQRLRESRLGEPPGQLESTTSSKAVVDAEAREQGHKTLTLGDRGDEVMLAQTKLYSAIGEPTGMAPGNFGDETEKAVRKFQSQTGIGVDGMVGPQTWAALDAVAGDRAPEDVVTIDELRKRKIEADEALDSGDFATAEPIYKELYARRDVPPIIRFGITFGLATCAQADRRFDEAVGLYREYMDLPGLADDERADALQRVRECRQLRPPGRKESVVSAAAEVPDVAPG